MSVELFDTHAHLHFPDFDADRAETLARARQAGVTRVLTIGTEVPTSRAAIALAESAAEADEATLAEIERLAGAARVAAVGEIGLDFFRNLSPRDAQERVFRHLIGVARRAGKPVLVHCRDAHAEVLAILAEERASEVGGIMHCFSGDVAIARRCLDLGLLVSLAGPVTYPNARALPEVARFVPADGLVVETDCPFLPPQGYRGKRNEPAYLALTAARVAELRGEPLEVFARHASDNARRLLRIG